MNINDVKAEAVKAWARKIRHEITWVGATVPWLESVLSEMWQQAYDAGRRQPVDWNQGLVHDNFL